MSWSDLAREYPGGVAAFKSGWLHFRDSMPPSPGAGPRLVMVVGSIDPAVRPALEVLAASGVEVHEMSLREMSNGRSFLEVHAVGPRTYAHAPHLLAGRSEDVPAIASSIPEVTVTSVHPVAQAQVEASEEAESAPGEAYLESAEHSAADDVELYSDEVFEYGADAENAIEREGEDPHHHAAPQVNEEAGTGLVSEEEAEELARAREAGIPVLARDAAALRVLGQIIAEDVPAILLEAPQANCEFTADGLLRAGEQTWTDPQEALVHFQVGGDAWALWHLGGEEGPTLGESLAEVNREIIREYSREG